MHVITHRAILEFSKRHPHAAKPLDAWYRIMKRVTFGNHAQLKSFFNSADRVGDYHVFDIAGNRYRLIAAVKFDAKRVYVRSILTHAEYEEWRPA